MERRRCKSHAAELTVALCCVESYAGIFREIPFTVVASSTLTCEARASKCFDVECAVESSIFTGAIKVRLLPFQRGVQCRVSRTRFLDFIT